MHCERKQKMMHKPLYVLLPKDFLLKPKFPFPMCPLVINHSLSVSILMPNVRKNRLTNPITADFRKKLDLVNNIISDIPKPSLLCAYTFQLKCLEGTEVCSFS